MAKKKQEEVKKLRYDIQCKICGNSYQSNTLDNCKCGSSNLFADDHEKLTSRRYFNGLEVTCL